MHARIRTRTNAMVIVTHTRCDVRPPLSLLLMSWCVPCVCVRARARVCVWSAMHAEIEQAVAAAPWWVPVNLSDWAHPEGACRERVPSVCVNS